MVILFIIVLSFLVGLNNLYEYYNLKSRLQVQVSENGLLELETDAENAFGT